VAEYIGDPVVIGGFVFLRTYELLEILDFSEATRVSIAISRSGSVLLVYPQYILPYSIQGGPPAISLLSLN